VDEGVRAWTMTKELGSTDEVMFGTEFSESFD